MTSILFGILAAMTWGGGDFAGGLASRRTGAFTAVLYAEAAGMVVLIAAIPIVHETVPSLEVLLIAFLAGAIGSFALIFFYRAMATGQMSIAAPVSALLTAAVPILIGAFTEGFPGWLRWAGFAFALAAVWLISKEDGDTRPHLHRLADLRFPFLAGLGFGLYFVLIHEASRQAILWPLIAGRTGGILLLFLIALLRRSGLRVEPAAWGLIWATAVMDLGGNLFYILAGQAGRLDVAAVLSSLYPGGTVFLAWLFLKERLSRLQGLGVLAALAAILFMTI